MSVSTSLDFHFANRQPSDALVVEILESLVNTTWQIPRPCQHLQLGDVDDYNWVSSILDRSELVGLVRAKLAAHEKPGFLLTERESGRGGQFLYFGDGQLSFNPSYDRLTLTAASRTTDFSWYLERLVPVLSDLRSAGLETINIQETL